jgi:iron(III) transport system ATP-binding protein
VLSLVPSHHNHAIGERIGIRVEIDHLVAFPQAAHAAGSDPSQRELAFDSRLRGNQR